MRKIKLRKILATVVAMAMMIPTVSSFSVFAAAKKVTLTSATALNESSVKLKWKKLSSAKGYEIYQKKAGSTFKKIKTISKKSTVTYKVTKLTSGTEYSYKIKSFQVVKGKKKYSAFSATKTTVTYPSAPSVISAEVENGVVAVSLKKVTGAKGYVIYKKANGVNTMVKSVKGVNTTVSGVAGEVLTTKAYLTSNKKTVYSKFSKDFVVTDNVADVVPTESTIPTSVPATEPTSSPNPTNPVQPEIPENIVTKDEFDKKLDEIKAMLDSEYATKEGLTAKFEELKNIIIKGYVSNETMESYFAEIMATFGDYVGRAEFAEALQNEIAKIKADLSSYCLTKDNLDTAIAQIKSDIEKGYATKESLTAKFDELKNIIIKGYVSNETMGSYFEEIMVTFGDYVSRAEFAEALQNEIAKIKADLSSYCLTKDNLDTAITQIKTEIENGYATKESLTAKFDELKNIIIKGYVSNETMESYLSEIMTTFGDYVGRTEFAEALQNEIAKVKADLSSYCLTKDNFDTAIAQIKSDIEKGYATKENFADKFTEIENIIVNGYVSNETISEYLGEIDARFDGIITTAEIEELVNEKIEEVKTNINLYYVTKESLDSTLQQLKNDIKNGYATKETVNQSIEEIRELIVYGYVSNDTIGDYLNEFMFTIEDFDEDLAEFRTEINNIKKALNSPLKGKRIAVLGDDISNRQSYSGYCYTKLIEDKTGCTFVDYTKVGSKIAENSNDSVNSFVERYSAMDKTADGVVVMGGMNDFNSTKLGDFNSTDKTTFYGAMNELLNNLSSMYAGKPIIFCAPVKTAETNYSIPLTEYEVKQLSADTLVTKENISAAMSLKCRQYGVVFVDLASETGISGYDKNNTYFQSGSNVLTKAAMQRIANVMYDEISKHFVFAG